MTTVTFYERRKETRLVDFEDRRTTHRRRAQTSVMVERRRPPAQARLHARCAFQIPASILMEKAVYSGQTIDLSGTGVCVASDLAFRRGARLTLQFSFRQNACQLSLTGEVVFCHPSSEDPSLRHVIGVRFLDARDVERNILASVMREAERDDTLLRKMSLLHIAVCDDVLMDGADDHFSQALSASHDRRSSLRVKETLFVRLRFTQLGLEKRGIWDATTLSLSCGGLAIATIQALPEAAHGHLEIPLPDVLQPLRILAKIVWRDDARQWYGIALSDTTAPEGEAWRKFVEGSRAPAPERRGRYGQRDPSHYDVKFHDPENEQRKTPRRLADIQALSLARQGKVARIARADFFPRPKDTANVAESAKTVREWLTQKTETDLRHIGFFSQDAERIKGNIENFIGMAQIPIGVAGPLKVNGGFAHGTFYVPLATTEGTLVQGHAHSMQMLSMSGGVTTSFLRDETHIAPLFQFRDARTASLFVQWLHANFNTIKREAEKTTRHGKLERLEPHVFDRNVAVKFCYSTGDATGINIITIATDKACQFITSVVKPQQVYVQSNFSSIKKVTAHNFISGYGKSVVADALVPATLIKRFYSTTPNDIVDYYHRVVLSTVHGGMVGSSGQGANALTALFAACGQDIASVVESHVSVTNYELTPEGDLYVSVKLPNLIVGTMGGGTGLATQRECLDLLGCYGRGRAKKFAEIVAATVLAGEIDICAANTAQRFVRSFVKARRRGAATSQPAHPASALV